MELTPFYIVSYTSEKIKLPLHDVTDIKSGAKVSVIIGPNGSGKSSAIASLVDELEMMYLLLTSSKENFKKSRHPKQAEIEFRYGKDIYKINRDGIILTAFKNEISVSLDQDSFPRYALAVAHLPTDKFRFSRNDDNLFYRYLGLRQATNMVTTGALEAKVISSLLNESQCSSYHQALEEWLKVLNIGGDFEIEFRGFTTDAFNINGIKELNNISRRTQYRSVEEYINHLQETNDASITESSIAIFLNSFGNLCNELGESDLNSKRKRKNYTLPLNLLIDDSNANSISWEQGVEIIRKLRLADEIRLIFSKNGQRTAFSDLSSGERCVIGTVARLFEFATERCVIAIDEPEVSLHPSWQIKYIPTLMKAMRHLKSAHVLIATHSHFLVSDVDESSSLVIASNNDAGQIQFDRFDGDVYGRTPDNILYRVFGVGAATNFYVERDLSEALHILSEPENMNLAKLKEIRNRLDKVSADDNPAFNEILNIMDKALGRV
ncbi:AAA family ATPase [Yersinia enterocolitica]|uniref:AAA family ATPase n=1 Tax=Yersinia enterocolitica TaxID=630 RepID=UPI0027E622DC|nr:AAA family ATPase [Yersinia enterocolitica]EKN6334257.1 hypothetical protein [Yersinia enterocolitica]HDT6099104.1 AAA family ATPase [Yersinia enterocolitica]